MKKSDNKIKKTGLYIAESLVVAACAVFLVPKVVNYLSDKIYTPESPLDDDDWGPEIIKREQLGIVTSNEKGEPDGEL